MLFVSYETGDSVSPPSQTAEKIMVRLPDGMRDDLKIRAIRNRRTMNAEVVHLIEVGLRHIDGANEKAADERELADR
jgi:plasmid stability protein